MNCKQADKILLKQVLESFSLFPSKISKTGAFYYAVERKEQTPSLYLNYARNKAYDFGNGKTYNTVALVRALKSCSVSEALTYLSQLSSFPKQTDFAVERKKEDWTIQSNKPVQHLALIRYLKKRKVYNQRHHLREIHYTVGNKKFFGIGFQNDSKGWEIRNKYAKVCLGTKVTTTIENGRHTLRIFEGFFDYLSFLQWQGFRDIKESDYLVLNSVSLVEGVPQRVKRYSSIELYLDNDKAGNRATKTLKDLCKNAQDKRLLYHNFKDVNDWIKQKQ